jgi:flagellar biosynthesis chaperone FliJ
MRAETARARAGLAASRTALESVETLQQRRLEAAKRAAERRSQLDLEDHARQPSTEFLEFTDTDPT